MLIQELSIQASLDLLARTRLGRLAGAQGPQPYVVPCYFVYDANYLSIAFPRSAKRSSGCAPTRWSASKWTTW